MQLYHHQSILLTDKIFKEIVNVIPKKVIPTPATQLCAQKIMKITTDAPKTQEPVFCPTTDLLHTHTTKSRCQISNSLDLVQDLLLESLLLITDLILADFRLSAKYQRLSLDSSTIHLGISETPATHLRLQSRSTESHRTRTP